VGGGISERPDDLHDLCLDLEQAVEVVGETNSHRLAGGAAGDAVHAELAEEQVVLHAAGLFLVDADANLGLVRLDRADLIHDRDTKFQPSFTKSSRRRACPCGVPI
jgi:hypothetical protein